MTSYADTSVAEGATYYYRMIAVNGAGNSAPSNTASVTTLVTPTVPAAPSGLSASADDIGLVNLTWTDNSDDETGFQLQRAADAGFTVNVAVNLLGADITSFADTSVAEGITYYYKVIAFNGVGNSDPSNTAVVTTLVTPTAPAGPTGLTASAATGQVNLSWTDNADNEDGFHLQRAADAGFTNGLTSVDLPADTTGYADMSVADGTTYYYRVIAYNGVGDSGPSNTATATTPSAIDAEAIFNTYCVFCHSASKVSGGTVSHITDVINNGKGSMPGYSGTLTPEEIDALAQWLSTY